MSEPGRGESLEAMDGTLLRWVGRQLRLALLLARLRLWARLGAATLVLALLAGLAAFTNAALSDEQPDLRRRQAMGAAGLAALASALTGLGLYPILRQRDIQLVRAGLAIGAGNFELLAVLGKLTELRGGDTAGHSVRVTCYTLLFAEELGFSPAALVRAVKGALLHDVGKLVVPDRVLGKPGPLTDEERREMASHVARGVEVVRQSSFLAEATFIVAAHHERFDGTGYPLGLSGTAIPREARMFALIDVFDALTSPRVYKPALSVDEALATMAEGRGSQFDPDLFDRFARFVPIMLERAPVGEQAQAALLVNRLRPYLGRIMLGQKLSSRDAA